MGLGKTLQALGIASAYRSQWPLLVVCPSSVRFSWRDAVMKWLPSVSGEDITVITSGMNQVIRTSMKSSFETPFSHLPAKDFLCNGEVVIISYDLLPKKEFELQEKNFKVAVMDEAHSVSYTHLTLPTIYSV